MSKVKSPYVFPQELEPYRDLIANTGGNEIEDLMTRYLNEPNLMQTNVVVACLGMCVESQITLLLRLRESGKLNLTTGDHHG